MVDREERHFHTYIGDAVYAYMDDWLGVVLYTSNGLEETNRIVLESDVLVDFLTWVELSSRGAREMIEARGKGVS